MLSHFSRVRLFVTLWTGALQALSMGFSRREYWSGLPYPPQELPNRGTEPATLKSPALADGFFTTSTTWPCLACLSVAGKSEGISSRRCGHGNKAAYGCWMASPTQ